MVQHQAMLARRLDFPRLGLNLRRNHQQALELQAGVQVVRPLGVLVVEALASKALCARSLVVSQDLHVSTRAGLCSFFFW